MSLSHQSTYRLHPFLSLDVLATQTQLAGSLASTASYVFTTFPALTPTRVVVLSSSLDDCVVHEDIFY